MSKRTDVLGSVRNVGGIPGGVRHRVREKGALGLTTTDLAKKVHISQAQVSRLETGQQGFRSDTLVRIAQALNVPPFRLFMTDKEWAKWRRSR